MTDILGKSDSNRETRQDVEALTDADARNDEASTVDIHSNGVEKITAISAQFDRGLMIILSIGIFLLAYGYGLDGTVRYTYQTVATNGYAHHSLLGTMNTVRSICAAVIQPPYAKVADRFGRLELLSFALVFYVLGTIVACASNNLVGLTVGQLLYQIGYTGLMLLLEVIIGDTSTLRNRVFMSILPTLPFIINSWVSGNIASATLNATTWRWGFGMFCIIVPFCATPIFASLIVAQTRARNKKILPKFRLKEHPGQSWGKVFWDLGIELDVVGIILVTGALTLILLPLTLAGGASQTWKTARIIVMIVIGAVFCIPAFIIWELKFAKYPVVPFKMFTNRTVIAGMFIAILLNFSWTLQGDFLYTVLTVSFEQSVTSATRILNVFSFTSCITVLILGLVVRKVRYVKPFVNVGTLFFIIAYGLLIKYRNGESGVGGMIGAQIVLGFGAGLFSYPTQALVQAACAHDQLAIVTALYLTMYQIGSALGNCVSTAIWTQYLPKKLNEELGSTLGDSAFATPLTFIVQYPPGTPEHRGILSAYGEVQRYLTITGICLSIVLFVTSLFLQNFKMSDSQSLQDDGKLQNVDSSEKDEYNDENKSWRNNALFKYLYR